MRKKMVAGNWKMNNDASLANTLLYSIGEKLENPKSDNIEVVVCPPYPYLDMAIEAAEECEFSVGAQNVAEWEKGAYTGEVSAEMLKSMEVRYCIVGHSERRKYFQETDTQIKTKVSLLLKNELLPIVCCGEVLEEREANNHFKVVEKQITDALFDFTAEEFGKITIAYEPVWAIGTGKTASPAQAQEMHAFIRGLVEKKYGKTTADDLTILYGGSCNAKNAKELFANPDVDGGLIGGASLIAEDFVAIVESLTTK